MERTISIGRINAIKRVKAEIESVRESMNELGAPILTDWALLPDLYKLFRESFSNRHVYSGVDHRRKFIFVALYPYLTIRCVLLKGISHDRQNEGYEANCNSFHLMVYDKLFPQRYECFTKAQRCQISYCILRQFYASINQLFMILSLTCVQVDFKTTTRQL